MSRMLALLGAATLLTAVAAHADTITFKASLSGGAEVPPKVTDGKGTTTATLDTATKVLTYTEEYTGLSGPATAAHFHGPAEPGANAPVAVPFPSAASPINGTATLTDAQMADLMAGKWYANIHTAATPPGQTRAQRPRAQNGPPRPARLGRRRVRRRPFPDTSAVAPAAKPRYAAARGHQGHSRCAGLRAFSTRPGRPGSTRRCCAA